VVKERAVASAGDATAPALTVIRTVVASASVAAIIVDAIMPTLVASIVDAVVPFVRAHVMLALLMFGRIIAATARLRDRGHGDSSCGGEHGQGLRVAGVHVEDSSSWIAM
jgi:hypothetical protein